MSGRGMIHRTKYFDDDDDKFSIWKKHIRFRIDSSSLVQVLRSLLRFVILFLTLAAICLVGKERDWYSVAAYFDKHADDITKKKLRSSAQKRGYLEKKGFKIQKDSRFRTCSLFHSHFLRDHFNMCHFMFFGWFESCWIRSQHFDSSGRHYSWN